MEKYVYLKRRKTGKIEVVSFDRATEDEVKETLSQDFLGESNYAIKDKPVDVPQLKYLDVENSQVILKDKSAAEIRRIKIAEIDSETQQSIAEGFTYDGQTFSLSQNAQLNWQRLLLLHQNKLFGESRRISTKDNQTYVLKAANLQAFIRAGQSAIETALEAGRSRKQALHEG